MKVDETGSSSSVGTPRHVLDDPFMRDTGGAAGGVANYDVAPSGEKFVMVDAPSIAGDEPVELHLARNWAEELRERVPN